MKIVYFTFIYTLVTHHLLADDLQENIRKGNITLTRSFGEHKLELSTAEQFAGAIYSLKFDGYEILDAVDHGRELQSASNFDAGSPITNETYNPTEAGSVVDRDLPKTSSKLLHVVASQHELQTTTQMAFWLAPGGKSGGHPAKNKTLLSNHLLLKEVKLGYREWPYVIPYEVTFKLPVDEKHTTGTLEALTGYMPIAFEQFIRLNQQTSTFEALNHEAGEQQGALIFTTLDGKYAMGCYAPKSINTEHPAPGYGRFMFREQRVTKWNIVYRYHDPAGIKTGAYTYRMFVIVHDLETVKKTMLQLVSKLP